MATAIDDIKSWLESGKSLTQKESTQMFGETRLADKVFHLRKKYGMDIRCVMVEGTNKYGMNIRYGKYFLAKE